MGRFLMYAAIAALAVFVLMVSFVTEQGDGSIASTSQVRLHDLRTSPESFNGRTVTTEGVLSYADETQVFQLVADDLAVSLRGYDGALDLSAHTGKQAVVSGSVIIDPDLGVLIEVSDLKIVD